MVGSRFTNKSESNYAPIEGELLAVSYGLKKTKYYTLGSEKLTVCVDHSHYSAYWETPSWRRLITPG